eukprot:Skav219356  [mRNA]  locus=scaffold76:498557:500053:- [translate_table: standard]
MQQWRQQYIPETITGGKGGLGSEDTAAQLQTHFARSGGYMVTLDYSRCYDAMRPATTVAMLETLDFPSELYNLLGQAWGSSQRWIQWEQHTHPQPISTGAATPQGCPLAPYVLQLWMAAGANAVKSSTQQSNNTFTRVYMDDRTFVSPTFEEAMEHKQQWEQWSRLAALQENPRKVQITAKTQTQKNILQANAEQTWNISDVEVLGTTTTSTGRRKIAPKEAERLARALERAALLDAARLPFHVLLPWFQKLAVPLCSYGWVSRTPNKDDCAAIFSRLTKATHSARMANVNIRKCLYGASLHLDIVWPARTFRSIVRLRGHGLEWQNQAATPVGMFRRWMKKRGWQEARPWQWKKFNLVLTADDSVAQPIAAAQDILRQGWRQFMFQSWLGSKRHEAQELGRQYTERQLVAQFDQIDLDATRKALLAATPPERSVLLGAAVSPAWMSRATGDNVRPTHWVQDVTSQCPWCASDLGHWSHMNWSCPEHFSCRPRKPRNV